MKKNKLFFIIASIALIIFSGVSAFGFAKSQETTGRKLPDTIYTREDAESTKTIATTTHEAASSNNATSSEVEVNQQEATATKITKSNEILNYHYTDAFDPKKPIDIYTDSNNGQYRYDRSGRLLNYINFDHNLLINPEQSITSNQATTIAYSKLKATYGTLIDTMDLISCETPASGSFPGQYEIKYEKRTGNGNFIYVYGITIHVALNGDVLGFSLSSSAEKEALDTAIFKDITETTLNTWVAKQIATDPSSKFSGCQNCKLSFNHDIYIEENRPYIRICVSCDNSSHGYPSQYFLYSIS